MATRATNLVSIVQTSCEQHADRPIFGTKKDGAWSWITYREFGELVDRARGGLASLGVERGTRVAIIADNCVEWAAAAYATYGLEAAFVPMYQSQRPSDWEFILSDCEARVVFVRNEAIYDSVGAMRPRLPKLAHVICLDRPKGEPDAWPDLLEAGAARPVPAETPDPDTIAGFIYTSGTTGKPKGALLTHDNIASNVAGIHEIFSIEPDDRSLSFLPWAHSMGQTCELHMLISFGASTAINDELPHLIDNLPEVKPTVLIAVPRIFNRIYQTVQAQIAEHSTLLQRIIRSGVRGALKRAHGERLGPIERLELAFDDKVVFGKIRQRFGGRLRYVISGSATLSHEVADFIDALGLPVYEGYGLTETSPIVTANSPGSRRLGSVGKVLPGVRVVIDTSVTGDDKEGEIVVHGPNVMTGYHNRPEENAAALTEDHGLRTGDLGHLDADGFLFITGRIKEQYKLENGKYVMPSPLEEELKLSPYIANAMIYGDGRPYNVALLVVDAAAVRTWAGEKGFTLGDDFTRDDRVRALLRAEIDKQANEFKKYEVPREFMLVADDFTIDNGLLTPTLKLKRREVLARHGKLIDEMYANHPDHAAA